MKKSVVSLFEDSAKAASIKPTFEIAKGKTFRTTGGMAHVEANLISIAEWILADPDQTRLIVRHELAHLLHYVLGCGGTAHGKEFKRVLKCISGRNYKKDLHWQPSPKINRARIKLRLAKF